ncbi:MAG: shikimate kinase [Oscillospiraceae bacterium]|nr:shikimate kinase [Oscillospiraceae bacterium]
MKCGLLGRKLGHSYSPQIHAMLGEYSYELFEKEPEEIEDFLKNGYFDGINVTVPYKKAVIPYLDELTPIAEKLGAVNTIVRRNGKLIGHNTDYFGFLTMVRKSGLDVAGKKVLVLGSGGASNTAVSVLRQLGSDVVVVSRSGENNYENLQLHQDVFVIVNTTPVGMYPHTGISPVSLDTFPALEGVLDVVYNPARTKLLLDAEKRGIIAMNGLLMLVAQAKEAAEWFTNSNISNDVIASILDKLKAQMQNIVLIGMPGCGKSTVGRIIAGKTGRRFADADDEIVNLARKTIPEIFAQDGEEFFRSLEAKVLEELGKQSGLVIATGGGCVTKKRNYGLLHQNGAIFWIQKNISDLPTNGRPLSQHDRLEQMYRIREPLYEQFRDWIICNDSTPEDVAEQILHIVGGKYENTCD